MSLPYRHFCYRSHRLDLSQYEILELERVFGALRFLSNYFTTSLQKTPLRKLLDADFHYASIRAAITDVMRTESFNAFSSIADAFIDAEAYAISERWVKYTTKDGPLPPFRQAKDEQCAWVLDEKHVSVQSESFFLPNSRTLVKIPEPKFKMVGTPSCYQLRRQLNNKYYLGVLYERPMGRQFTCDDPTIPFLGKKLQALLSDDPAVADMFSTQPGVIDYEQIYKLRKTILSRFFLPRTPAHPVTGELAAA